MYVCAMILTRNLNGFYIYHYTPTAVIFIASLSDESL